MAERALERAAEGVVDQNLSRRLLPWICGVAMSIAAFVGVGVFNEIKDITKTLGGIQIDLAILKTDISYLKQRNEP